MDDMTYDKWHSLGESEGYLIKYLTEIEFKYKKAKEQLEEAFTPHIKSLLDKKVVKELEKDE
jgi:hypothetical protein